MNVHYRVELTDDERVELKSMLAKGKRSARKLKRAQVLLGADAGESDEAIAANVCVGTATVFRIKRRFVEGNLERALSEQQRPGAKRKLSGKEEALLVATACSAPPLGRARWTLELLAGSMVTLTEHDELSRETVRRRLSESKLKPWRQEMWCVPEINGEYVARMEHVLDLYAQAPDPLRPLVCFDESPTQLIGEVREPIPAKPGQLQRYDSEYQRNGTVNLFVLIDAHRCWRHVKITERRTLVDFAHCMRELVDVHYPSAQVVRVVLDNLSTHTSGALYEAFDAEEARRILRRIEFHFVPKHGSWLNMAEIEIGVLRNQCLDRRIEDVDVLRVEVAAWQQQRNDAKATIEWTFTTEKARQKMGRAYPKHNSAVPNVPTSEQASSMDPAGSIDAGSAADSIDAGSVADSIDAGSATDSIDAGSATDSIDTSSAADSIDAGSATDSIDTSSAADSIDASLMPESGGPTPVDVCPTLEPFGPTPVTPASQPPVSSRSSHRPRKRASRRLRSRFKATPIVLKQPKSKPNAQPFKITVRSY